MPLKPYLERYDIDAGEEIPFRFLGLLIEAVESEAAAVQMTFACLRREIGVSDCVVDQARECSERLFVKVRRENQSESLWKENLT